MKIKMLVSYDGTDFAGWQRQKSHQPTIQGSLEGALARIFNQPISLCGSGRTDAGVHARAQVAHFWAPKEIGGEKLLYALNSLTPKGVAIQGLWRAPDHFHAMVSARKKAYIYEIYNSQTPSALRERFSLWLRDDFDLELLNRYSQILLGRQDFKSFQTNGSGVQDTVREIFEARWERLENNRLTFRITGDGFLRQMVRNIVGTLIELHRKRAEPSILVEILQSLDRRVAGTTALPQGLCLHSVSYPTELDNQCRKL